MKNLVKGVALVGAATTAGVVASQRRDHLQLQGPVTNCYLGPAIECTQNATHTLLSSQTEQTMMVKGPNGIYTVEAEHGHPLGNQPSPPPVVPKPTKNPSSTPPPALAQYLAPAPPVTPSPAPPQASSSNFPLDSVIGAGVSLFIFATIVYSVFRHIRHERNRIPIAEIPMATITDDRNVVAPQLNSLLGTIQEDLRVTRDNVLPHRQLVYNAIPTPTSLPSDNGITGVILDSQIQQPDPGPLESSAPQQQTSNLGQGLALSLPSQLRRINLGALTLELGASVGFVDSRHQPASENPENAPQASTQQSVSVSNSVGAPQAPASSPSRTPSTTPSRSSSPPPSPPPLTISLVLPSQGVDVSPATSAPASAPASATEQQSSQQVQQTQQQTLSAQLVYYAQNEPLAISSSPQPIVNIASQQPPQRTQQRAAAFASADLVFRQP